MTMFVTKRNGSTEAVCFDKITQRITNLCYDLDKSFVSAHDVARKVINGMTDNIKTSELDDLAASIATNMAITHSDYNILAGRIAASNLQKSCPDTFSESIQLLYDGDVINRELWSVVQSNADKINDMIQNELDFVFEFFAMSTMIQSYLLQVNEKVVETPQYMFMRVALAVYGEDLEMAFNMYKNLANRMYIHASPTLFNAGTTSPQLASCFLVDMKDDSIDGIYDTLKVCARISKTAGGIGLAIDKVRSKGQRIGSTNGKTDGIVSMLKVYNATARYVNQAGRRNGSIAIYLQPHHPDFMSFLELKKPTGHEDLRTRDLFTAAYISDLFMERVMNDGMWSFFDPKQCPGLDTAYDEKDDKAYTKLYTKYEEQGLETSKIPAIQVWNAIIDSQIESGVPYITNKDQANRMSNQKHLGTIKSSNLCNEILQFSSPEETAVCNLASICLPRYVDVTTKTVNYKWIASIAGDAIDALNKVIDKTYYPTECSKRSNLRHRPLGLGVSGLADLFFLLRIPFDSTEAKEVNKKIFEAIYYGALRRSTDLAKMHGPYPSYMGSPMSQGKLNHDLWDTEPLLGDIFDWQGLRDDIHKHGTRNSLLVALMPTASSSTILGVNECFEPITSNMYTRKTKSGEFTIVNKFMIRDLCSMGKWSRSTAKEIIASNGSIAGVKDIPDETKNLYKTAWEMSNRAIIDMAQDRSPWVDQSQSMNLFLLNPKRSQLSRMFKYAYKANLKTIVYYLRMQVKMNASVFNIADNTGGKKKDHKEQDNSIDECLACSA